MATLIIPGLRLWISVGCSEEERAILQPVDIDIRIQFMHDLAGFYSDQLSETVCYHTIVDLVIEFVKDKSFHLIERVATSVYELVACHLEHIDAHLEVSVTKPHPPIPHLQKGVTFNYSGRVSQKSL